MTASIELLGGKRFKRHRTASFTRFGDEGLLVLPRQSTNIVLNGSGARAFELFDGSTTVTQIAEQIFSEYDAPSLQQVQSDVVELVADLLHRGALEEIG